MRRLPLALLAAVLLLISGCSALPEVGDFSFSVPAEYHISHVTDRSCAIVNGENIPVGGVNLTDLLAKDIRKGSDELFRYLNEVAWGCEFFSWHGGDRSHPLQYMSLTVTDPETQQKQEFYRVFFTKDSGVYDMWFDLSLIDQEEISAFLPIAEAKE